MAQEVEVPMEEISQRRLILMSVFIVERKAIGSKTVSRRKQIKDKVRGVSIYLLSLSLLLLVRLTVD